mmetsp:Transcript_14832/g.22225  ORF Transcript_14832/g.22225 Transcript_14832/m.22225 type:complete len:94 (+) Transcript_14832:124-405(+)
MITDSSKVDPFQLAWNVYARKKYSIMLKVGVPRVAVDQTRTRDGPRSSFGHHTQCMKYKRMIKLGIPIAAVKQKMTLDGMGHEANCIAWWNYM